MGQKFGRLTVLFFIQIKNHRARWLCKCDCGNLIEVASSDLIGGNTKSCGCYQSMRAKEANLKHGYASRDNKKRIYKIWAKIKRRIFNKNTDGFSYYGGKGIKMCSEWMDFINFKNWALENGYKDILSIDRIDSDGDYKPENCQWIPINENCRKAALERWKRSKSRGR